MASGGGTSRGGGARQALEREVGHEEPGGRSRVEIAFGRQLLQRQDRGGARDTQVARQGPRRGDARAGAQPPFENGPPDAAVDLPLQAFGPARVDVDEEARGTLHPGDFSLISRSPRSVRLAYTGPGRLARPSWTDAPRDGWP